MTVREYLMDCIFYELSSLAHYVHHLVMEKKLSYDDDESLIDLNQADHEKVASMIRENVLGFHKVGIYSLKVRKGEFYFVFARSEQEAIEFFCETFHHPPLNCIESLLDYEFCRGKDIVTFRDMRREFDRFPAVAGYYSKLEAGGRF